MRKISGVLFAGLTAAVMTGLCSCSTEMSQEPVVNDNLATLVNKELKQEITEDEETKYNHKVVIDYSYTGPEDGSCDSYVLRKVDDQEEEVVDLSK